MVPQERTTPTTETEDDSRLVTIFNGDRMYIDSLDSLELGKNGIYEREETKFISAFVRPNMTCVDIGANIGYYTLLMANYAKHVIAFEPDEWNYYTLSRNLLLNNVIDTTFVESYPFAIGPQIQMVTLHRCATNGGMHRVYPSHWCKASKERVLMVPLDKIITHADFIKIDVEGAEYGALLGMKRILQEERPTLLMEFHTPSIWEYGVEPKNVYDFIINLGYTVCYLTDRNKILSYNELMKKGDWPGINILCTPS